MNGGTGELSSAKSSSNLLLQDVSGVLSDLMQSSTARPTPDDVTSDSPASPINDASEVSVVVVRVRTCTLYMYIMCTYLML